ncbi:glutamate-gated chloride channel alpha-like isoform X1 [Crassostrea angulata]|uniref:glutamate-gated chloride channel alpha-like isoform X1 n=2 Tax=Magallana angulata TaxID=2784310 RepID=UPI0022B13272|nr:glutamate-gated chloride channel alpha-like isoform X1 [Crassostrea angulata]
MAPSCYSYFMTFLVFSLDLITSSGTVILPPWEVPDNGGKETKVTMSLYVTQFRSVLFDAEMTFDIHQSWTDPRFKNTSRNPNDYNIYRAEEFENIWRPDTYIANEMPNGVFETTPTDNIYAYFNGSLFLTTRHSIIFHCDVKLFALPIKDETCSLYFKSASYSSKNLKLIWKHVNPVLYSQNMETYAVKIHKTESQLCPQEDNVPCVHMVLHVQRKHQVMIVQVYLPSTCIVVITWLGFWIHHTEVSGRTRISTISLTAIVAESVAVLIINPDQVHIAAIEAWNSGCMILITLAFLEFVIVHNYHRRRMANDPIVQPMQTTQGSSSETKNVSTHLKAKQLPGKKNLSKRKVSPERIHVVEVGSDANEVLRNPKNVHITPETIDRISSLIYAVLFLLFNVYYWSFFLTEADKK